MLKTIDHTAKFRDDVIRVFESMSRDNAALYKFLYEACIHCSVFFVGGFLRSVANAERPRDLDVIFNLSDDKLYRYITDKSIPTHRNRFGGFKLDFNGITMDVWASETNWAFVENVVATGHRDIISGIAHGTFLNYDSLVFDLRTQKINVSAYNECVRTQTLDIIRKSNVYAGRNPGKMANVIRAFRIRQKTGLHFSEALSRYIVAQFADAGIRDYDRAADYLLQFIATKPSEKYGLLQDRSVLQGHIHYIISMLEKLRQKEDAQLDLFKINLGACSPSPQITDYL
jgi:hypothetical protein